MFGHKAKSEQLDSIITQHMHYIEATAPGTPEYDAALAHLERLTTLKANTKRRVSPDTLALVAANLIGILIIVSYEHTHVMTSKATGFLQQPKLTTP